MVNPDLFESYLNLTLPKDISFVNSLRFPQSSNSNFLDKMARYMIIKDRVEDFSDDKKLMSLYSTSPLIEIESLILEKNNELRQSFNSGLLKLERSVSSYNGSYPRKFTEVHSDLEFFSVVNSFLPSSSNFDSIKQNISKTITQKVYGSKKSSHKKNYPILKSALFMGALTTSLYLGSFLFPKEKEVFTTLDSKVYEDNSISLQQKINQFATDRNYLLKQESNLVQDLIDENYSLQQGVKNGP